MLFKELTDAQRKRESQMYQRVAATLMVLLLLMGLAQMLGWIKI